MSRNQFYTNCCKNYEILRRIAKVMQKLTVAPYLRDTVYKCLCGVLMRDASGCLSLYSVRSTC